MASPPSASTSAPAASDEQQQQAAATSAFLDAMQQSHKTLQLQQPPQESRNRTDNGQSGGSGAAPAGQDQDQDQDNDDDDNDDEEEADAAAALAAAAAMSHQSPPRKAQKRTSNSTAKESSQAQATVPHHGTTSDAPPSGPPYICPTCQTSYSRLEYLRRHERRHQDIRPFVCECGKGFSRSDVLSRHKRQCHYHLTGEQPSPEAAIAAAKKTRKPSMTKGNKSSAAKKNGDAASQSDKGSKGSRNRDGPSGHSPPAADGGAHLSQPGSYSSATQPGPPPPLLPQSSSAPGSMVLPPPPPFYSQAGATGGATQDVGSSDYSRSNGFMSVISHALNNFGQAHPNYPPSPESSASINSRNSSPRLHYRDAIPYTQRSGSSSGSRHSSLRKGTLDPYHPPAPWDLVQDIAGRSSPAPPSISGSRPGSVYGGSGGHKASNGNGLPTAGSASSATAAPAFSYPANEFASAGGGNGATSNQTLVGASGEGPSSQHSQSGSSRNADSNRFALSTGPLSPFSGMGLTSISPYLSAFSNARDTPLVASPGRAGAPGTPTSSLSTNVFDYTMRPPAKPASTTTPGKAAASSTSSAEKSNAPSTSQSYAAFSSAIPAFAGIKRKELPTSSSSKDEPTTPSASLALSTCDSGSLPALADFIDDQQRNAANGLLTLLGGGGAETPSRFVRGEGAGGGGGGASNGGGSSTSNTDRKGNDAEKSGEGRGHDRSSAMENNPGTTSANPSSNPFFESAVTPGPEAFLLRLQGGEQERRAGLLGISQTHGNSINQISRLTGANGTDGPPSSALGGSGLATPGFTPFDIGSSAALTSSMTPSHSNGVGWLLSPSIQALISSFAPAGSPQGPGEGGSYFPLSRRGSHMGPGTPTLSRQQSQSNGFLGSWGSDMWLSGGSNQTSPQTTFADSVPSTDFTSVTDGTEDVGDLAAIGSAALEKALDDAANPFFIPKQLFRACYSIPHWELPPLTRLSVLAMHAQQNLLKHVPILHEPTFRIDTTPGCLAFASCMLGCHEVGRRWWAGEEVVPLRKTDASSQTATGEVKAEIPAVARLRAEQSIPGLTKALVDEVDGQELVKPIVMTEKVDMLMRSFAERCKSEKDRVSVVQALMLFQTNNFLSSDPTTRAIASISHGSVVSVARKAGLYDPDAKHVSQTIQYTAEQVVRNVVFEDTDLCFGYSFLPNYIPGCPDEEKVWRQWAEYEGRRRTAFLIFLMDMVASLDAGLPTLIEMQELKHLPLPVPDTIWRAGTAETFGIALKKYRGITLDEAMSDLLNTSDTAESDDQQAAQEGQDSEMKFADDEASEDAHAATESSGDHIAGQHGPFARLIMILPILQGIVHLLQSRNARAAAKPSPLEPWLASESTDATAVSDSDLAPEDKQVEPFKKALHRWRKAWDADELCLGASSPAASARAEELAKEKAANDGEGKGETPADAPGADDAGEIPRTFSSKTASGATPLCEDALPFYWLSHVLLGHATSKSMPIRRSPTASNGPAEDTSPHQQTQHSEEVNGETNGSAPSAARRIPDFRSMLRFAKAFVNSGEGNSGTPLIGKTATSLKKPARSSLSQSTTFTVA
ncbi:unnamed protein product [Parajaminaea phylloscopi]